MATRNTHERVRGGKGGAEGLFTGACKQTHGEGGGEGVLSAIPTSVELYVCTTLVLDEGF